MSESTPPPGQPEQLGGQPWQATPPGVTETSSSGGKKAAVIGGAVVGVAALVGGGVFAATSFLGAGAQPAEALPASTLAYVSFDLDPSGRQKIEAIRTLRKFPAFRDNLDLDTDDDVRRTMIEELLASESCESIDFDDDVAPWLGERLGAAVLAADESGPDLAVVLQVSDEEAADEGLAALKECTGGGETGHWSIRDGWAVVAETAEIAEGATQEAAESSLADDDTYQRWTGEVGDSGIVNLYAAPAAGKVLADLIPDLAGSPFGGLPGAGGDFGGDFGEDDLFGDESPFGDDDPFGEDSPFGEDAPDDGTAGSDSPFLDENGDFDEELFNQYLEEQMEMMEQSGDTDTESAPAPGAPGVRTAALTTTSQDDVDDALIEQLESFAGFAGVLRFDDGGLELAFASGIGDEAQEAIAEGGGDVGDVATTLPEDAAVVIGLGVDEGWYAQVIDALKEATQGLVDLEAEIAGFEAETGLDLATDAERLLGEGVAVVLGGDFTVEGFTNSADGSDVPIGIKIKGEPDDVEDVLGKLRAQMGPDGDQILGSETDGDFVAISPNPSFRSQLAEDGGLGDQDNFKDVIPNADDVTGLLYVNFDAGDDWLTGLVEQFGGGDPELIDNLLPLASLGISGWVDGDVSHAVFRIGTN